MSIAEFHYRIPWRASGAFPGSHAGRLAGTGYEIRAYAPIYAAADPRRFDLRASLRDPFGRLVVRMYNQLSAVPVVALADVSGSMGFSGHHNKWQALADFVTALAHSVHRAGDSFAFTACDTCIRSELTVAKTRDRRAGLLLRQQLGQFTPRGPGAQGLLAATEQLASTRSLVFLLSDFHFPVDLLRQLLHALSPHFVVPVVLWDTAEAEVPGFGIARVVDCETGASRTLLARPALSRRLQRAWDERTGRLHAYFAEQGLRPLFIDGPFDADAVTRYFYG